ncbi:MAG: host-nuclease inhibitor Gam family protein [Ignavibacteriales bacterium]|nr:host-nuclease inhibitor Gam family protein [Ignavibacteriales bacterium]
MDEKTFLEDLIKEAEEKEELRTQAFYDLLLLEISKLQDQIANNFYEAEKEIELINRFILSKNSTIQNKVDWLEKKLEAYIREKGEKTLEMPHGTLKMHKKPDRIEIADLDLFLKHAKKEMLSVIPEQIKPDLTKIKSFMKTNFPPKGVKIIEGETEFSYKLRKDDENVRPQKTRVNRTESTSDNEIALRQSA